MLFACCTVSHDQELSVIPGALHSGGQLQPLQLIYLESLRALMDESTMILMLTYIFFVVQSVR